MTKLFTINSIDINEVEHLFDSVNSDSSTFTVATDLPTDGTFIIISGKNGGIIQELGSALPIASEKRIVIRLGALDANHTPTTPPSGIALNSQFRVIINSSAETVQELLIPAGSLA